MNNAKKYRKTIEWERLETSLRKLGDTKGTFFAEVGTIKDKNSKDLTETEEIRKRLKNTQKSYTKKVLTTQKVWSLT